MNHLQLQQASLPDLSESQISRLPKDQLAHFSNAVQQLHDWTLQMRGRINRAMDSASRSDAKRREIETLKFLFDKTEISHSKRDTAHLRYLLSLAESSSCLSRILVFATGGFFKPSRIVLWTAIVIFGFAKIYWHEASGFDTTHPICSYWDALYFSGLTFTTIGYGDILPLHWMRGFAVLEGLLGIALTGAFLVSLTRRYID